MDYETTELGLYLEGDAALVVGGEADIDRLVAHLSGGSGVKGRVLARDAAAAVAALAGMAPEARTGRWIKLAPEPAARLRQFAGTDLPRSGSLAGVLLASAGRIDQQARFVLPPDTALDPAVRSVVANLFLRLSLQQSAEELGEYLAGTDVQPDELLQDGRAEAMGEIRGTTRTIAEVFDLYQRTGSVSPADWDEVRQYPASLASFAAQSLDKFDSMTELVSQGLVAAKAKAVQQLAADELPFWLSVLAVGLLNQKRFHVLELARTEQAHPADAPALRDIIAKHNHAMEQNAARALQRLAAALEQAGRVGDFDRVLQPLSAADLVQAVNQALGQIGRFAGIAQAGPHVWTKAAPKDWSQSVSDLAQKTGDAVGGVAKGIFAGVRSRAERAILEQAKRIEADQAARQARRGSGTERDLKDPGRS